MKLGFVVDGPRFLTSPGMQPVHVRHDVASATGTPATSGGSIRDLDDELRYDIIEFLKTFDDVNYPGDYKFERPAMLAGQRANEEGTVAEVGGRD